MSPNANLIRERPVSSAVSRIAAAARSSPGSTTPLGKSQLRNARSTSSRQPVGVRRTGMMPADRILGMFVSSSRSLSPQAARGSQSYYNQLPPRHPRHSRRVHAGHDDQQADE